MSTATACFAAPRSAAPPSAIQTPRRKWSSVSKRRCAPLTSVPRVPTSSRDGDASANVALSSGRLEKRVPSLLAKLGLQVSRHKQRRRGVSTATVGDRHEVEVEDKVAKPRQRRTYGMLVASLVSAAPLLLFAGSAMAGWYNDGGGPIEGSGGGAFVGGDFGAEGGDAVEYDYGTKDLAVDLASPLVAYKVVSWALNQEVPVWLDAIILVFVIAAVYVCVFDINSLDDVLV
eukprot:CAMPEP_0198681014 /NCGR_PEP_ID=MMETSP1468-20131203/5993_1 /TAXON_ID=1461545 /ORGANISM="Mantoniella sp, Strain CCMP1436" /LENGTH=230 /DNA_ID=CAMNT_0044422129 /DNA_START=64 /DNA_END=756 /DNA_ORIENTATION=+